MVKRQVIGLCTMTDLSTWEKFTLASPLAPLVGIPHKIKGAALNRDIRNRFAELVKENQNNPKEGDGSSSVDEYTRLAEYKAQMERENIDYYNEQRLRTEAAIREAEANQQIELKKMWAEHQAQLDKKEREQAEALAKFWLDYYRAKLELENSASANSGSGYEPPSSLNFGLI